MNDILYKKSENCTTVSGGIRVPVGLIEVTCDALVVWGIDNSIQWADIVSPGYRFNSEEFEGGWDEIVPHFHKDNGIYFLRISDCIPYDDVKKYNKEHNVFHLHVWENYRTDAILTSLSERFKT